MQLRPLGEALALVTGASSGIGAATAAALVAAGCRVVAAARRVDRLTNLAARLGPRCHAVALDVTDAGAVDSLLGRLPPEWRDIDILVNNAGHGVGGKVPFAEGPIAHWTGMMEANVNGLMRMTRALVPSLLARGGGQIVNLGSVAGVVPLANDAAYSASKFAVNGFSKALRQEYLGKIRVIEVLPGLVRTEFDEVRRHGDAEKAAAYYGAAAEVMQPEDIAACIVFALSRPPRVTLAELLVLPSA
jgi:3-hydroxy acid dehydrogenase / malonic semialdehyde reductase